MLTITEHRVPGYLVTYNSIHLHAVPIAILLWPTNYSRSRQQCRLRKIQCRGEKGLCHNLQPYPLSEEENSKPVCIVFLVEFCKIVLTSKNLVWELLYKQTVFTSIQLSFDYSSPTINSRLNRLTARRNTPVSRADVQRRYVGGCHTSHFDH